MLTIFHIVLVQTAVTKYKPDGLNNRNVILTILEAQKSKTKVPADCKSGEGPFLVHNWPSSHGYPHIVGKGEKALWGPF